MIYAAALIVAFVIFSLGFTVGLCVKMARMPTHRRMTRWMMRDRDGYIPDCILPDAESCRRVIGMRRRPCDARPVRVTVEVDEESERWDGMS